MRVHDVSALIKAAHLDALDRAGAGDCPVVMLMPTMIMIGTLIRELPPVMAPTAPVSTISSVRLEIWNVLISFLGGRPAPIQMLIARLSLRGSEPPQKTA